MSVRVLLISAVAATLALSPVAFAADAPSVAPPFTPGAKDFRLAPAGTYAVDGAHAGVIARVSHLGYSRSVFRFDQVAGTLTWDPTNAAATRLTATVKTGSIATNVPGFAEELRGDKFLNSAAFPDATFVSTAFRQTDATHGKVEGNLTMMGVTRPVVFDAELIGAGPGFGSPRIGVHAVAQIVGAEFGMNPFFSEPIELTIDVEFERKGA